MGDRFWVNVGEFLTNNLKENDHFGNEYPDAEIIGEGKLGVVYRAIKDTKEVAIKEIEVESLNDLAAAVEEVVMLKDVPPHPNVVKVYDDLSWYTLPEKEDLLFDDEDDIQPDDILNALKSGAAESVDCKGEFILLIMSDIKSFVDNKIIQLVILKFVKVIFYSSSSELQQWSIYIVIIISQFRE